MALFLQMHVPNMLRVYGSQYINLRTSYNESYRQTIPISKSHLKAIDQPSYRCAKETKTANVSACIASYIMGQLGCKAIIQGFGSPQKITCNNVTHLLTWQTLANELREADANKIYDITGCLASCEKDEYHEIVGSLTESNISPHDTLLSFRIMQGSYQVMEQYLLYDFDSFIADVGGLMGLLLGFSVLSIYNEIMDLLVNKWKVGMILGKKACKVQTKRKNWQ